MANTKNRRMSNRQGGRNEISTMESVENAGRDMIERAIERMRNYAHEKPESAALWCLGIGFVLGWKLKPW